MHPELRVKILNIICMKFLNITQDRDDPSNEIEDIFPFLIHTINSYCLIEGKYELNFKFRLKPQLNNHMHCFLQHY